jgi:DMSO/TMAO reductase YedYZ heme-binding membrane subunit
MIQNDWKDRVAITIGVIAVALMTIAFVVMILSVAFL